MANRLFANLAGGSPSLGVGITIPGVEVVDAYGAAGWDVFYAVMHSTRIDWRDVHDMVRAARPWGIASCVRIPMQPWVGGPNPVLTIDAHRAFSLGADAVMATVRGVDETRDLAELMAFEEQRLGRQLLCVPAIETVAGWDDLDSILAVPGLRMVFLGVSDLARAIGADGLDDPELRSAVGSFVRRAHARGVSAAVNVGYPETAEDAWDRSLNRVRWLEDAGADLVFGVPAADFLSSVARSFLRAARVRPAGAEESAADQ